MKKHELSSLSPNYFPYCVYWFKNRPLMANTIQVIASNTVADNSLGNSWVPAHYSVISTGGMTDTRVLQLTVIHEIGHQFVRNYEKTILHIDADPPIGNVNNHSATDKCSMSYSSNTTDNISEFCCDCIYYARDLSDPL